MATIAFLLGADFEDDEFQTPYDALRAAGHRCVVLGVRAGETLVGKRGRAKASVDRAVSGETPSAYDLLVIPGGYSPDHLRTDAAAVAFVRGFVEAGQPVAAICHGPQLLIEARVVRGRTLTSWPSVRTDLANAGATWVDRPIVVDGNLITSRKPDDLPQFIEAISQHLPVSSR